MEFKDTTINGRWTIKLPEARSNRPGWNWWEKERLAAMYAAIRPGDKVIDVGAEWGDLSALIGTWIGERGEMALIEPSTDMWPYIKGTWGANRLKIPKYSIVALASDNYSPDLTIDFSGSWPPVTQEPLKEEPGFVHLDEGKGFSKEVTLDYLSFDPDILNIDVEGSELLVLHGAERILKYNKPIVFVSIHPKFMYDRYGQTSDDLLVYMEKLGYTVSYLGANHEEHWMMKPGVL